MIAAIIPGAGAGQRMNDRTPKVFIELAGRPLAYYAVKIMAGIQEIDRIVLAAPEGWRQKAVDAAADWNIGNLEIIEGGATRQATVHRALESLPGETKMVVIHDGARPFASPQLVRSVIEGAREHGACVPVLPCEETVKRVKGGLVAETLDRSEIFIVQTPQAFYFEAIVEAHRHAADRKWRATDDATLIERFGRPVATVPGEFSNIKITRPQDFALATSILGNT